MKKAALLLFLSLVPFPIYAFSGDGLAYASMVVFAFILIGLPLLAFNFAIAYVNTKWKKIWISIINAALTWPLLYLGYFFGSGGGLLSSFILFVVAGVQMWWIWKSVQ